MIRSSICTLGFELGAARLGCRNNPAWKQKFRAVSDPKSTKIAAGEGTKSGSGGEIRLAGDTG
jgi:hypothetical protein